jgi:ABC-type branched-chain amino acid transport systems, ATPase component
MSNLKLIKGSIIGFIGPNGAGKTTFIYTITGLFAPKKRGKFSLRGRIDGVKPLGLFNIGGGKKFSK